MSDKIEDRIEQSTTPHPRTVFDLKGHAQAETQFLKAWHSGRIHHADNFWTFRHW